MVDSLFSFGVTWAIRSSREGDLMSWLGSILRNERKKAKKTAPMGIF